MEPNLDLTAKQTQFVLQAAEAIESEWLVPKDDSE